jgi:hypothetical protein
MQRFICGTASQLHKICNNGSIKPFENWEKSKPPSWWTAYNKIKHSRSDHFEKANLQNTIHASSGLLVIIKTIASELGSSVELFSGTKLMHAYEVPRYGTSYTGKNGEMVIDGGRF